MDESLEVLHLGLGNEHPEYAALVNLVPPPPHPVVASLRYARGFWEAFYGAAVGWPSEAAERLRGFSGRLRRWKESPAWEGQREARPNIGSSRPPPLAQLLEYDKAQAARAGRNQTLPQLLSGLRLSDSAFAQLRALETELETFPFGMGREEYTEAFLCNVPDLLEAVAQRQCDGNKTSVLNKRYPYRMGAQILIPARYSFEALRDALCDAEEFLGPLAAGAERVRDRVRAIVEERGGISQPESVASSFPAGDLASRLDVLDRIIDTFHDLYPALKLQRQLLAGVAVALQRACALQDALLERVRLLLSDQSALWNLEWDADRDMAKLTLVTLRELPDAYKHIQSELDRLWARDERVRSHEDVVGLGLLFDQEIAANWMQRHGVDRPPDPLTGGLWTDLRWAIVDRVPTPWSYLVMLLLDL